MAALLVVEDDGVQRKMLGMLLPKHFDVTLCDQFTAMDYDWRLFDAVLLDVLMPVHNGPELVRWAAERYESLPKVVFYSALPAELLAKEATALAGVVPLYYIVKSGSPTNLVEILKALCES